VRGVHTRVSYRLELPQLRRRKQIDSFGAMRYDALNFATNGLSMHLLSLLNAAAARLSARAAVTG